MVYSTDKQLLEKKYTGEGEGNRLANITNIERGHFYENTARYCFEKVAKAATSQCGFFINK